jgi:hypothetical protein
MGTLAIDSIVHNPVDAELEDDGDGDPNSNKEMITIIEAS